MSAMPPESFVPARPGPAPVTPGAAQVCDDGAFAARWHAVHQAAAVVAVLAALAPEPMDGAVAGFPGAMARAGGQRLAVARQGIEDLAVILETGIRALLNVHARGASPLPAAQALRAEFRTARDALLALAPLEKRPLG